MDLIFKNPKIRSKIKSNPLNLIVVKLLKKGVFFILKKIELGSAIAVRLTKMTGKSKVPVHPKHFLTDKPWFTAYLREKDTILDLGCGNGQSTIKAAKIVKKVIGVDKNYDLLTIARKSAKRIGANNVKFEKANLEEKIKFSNNSFEKVIFLDVLEHLNDRSQILKEIKRILKPAGLLFIGVPNSQTSWKKLQRSAGLCSFSDPDHKVEFSEKQIKTLLVGHGFIIKYFGYGYLDTPFRGLIDIIGGFSLGTYRMLSRWRRKKAQLKPKDASGFEIVAAKKK